MTQEKLQGYKEILESHGFEKVNILGESIYAHKGLYWMKLDFQTMDSTSMVAMSVSKHQESSYISAASYMISTVLTFDDIVRQIDEKWHNPSLYA